MTKSNVNNWNAMRCGLTTCCGIVTCCGFFTCCGFAAYCGFATCCFATCRGISFALLVFSQPPDMLRSGISRNL